MSEANIRDSLEKKLSQVVKKWLLKQGIIVDWSSVNVTFEPQGVSKLKVNINAESLVVSAQKLGFVSKFGTLNIGVNLKIGISGVEITKIGPINVSKTKIKITPSATTKLDSPYLELPSIPSVNLPKIISAAEIDPVHIEIDDIAVKDEKNETHIAAKIDSDLNDKDRFHISVSAKSKKFVANQSIKLNLQRESKSVISQIKLNGSYSVKAKEDKFSGSIDALLGETIDVKIKSTVPIANKSEEMSLDISGQGTRLQWSVKTGLSAASIEDILRKYLPGKTKISLSSKCSGTIDWQALTEEKRNPQSLSLKGSCQSAADLASSQFKKELPANWPLSINFKLDIPQINSVSPAFRFSGKVDSPLTSGKSISSKANIFVDASGRLTEKTTLWKIKPNALVRIELKDFKKIAQILHKTPYAIPASLNDLSGKVELVSELKRHQQGLISHIKLKTILKSSRQTLFTKNNFTVTTDQIIRPRKVKVDGRVELSDVKIQLPNILLESPPQMIADERFSRKQKNASIKDSKTRQTSLLYNIEVMTPQGKPMHLVSNIAKDLIPLHLNTILSHRHPTKIKVLVDQFRLKLFKRQAQVKKFNFVSRNDQEVADINGEIGIEYADYEITMQVSGTLEHTILNLKSEPPLSEDDIYSVLLFGEPMQNIESGQAGTSTSMKAAATTGALTLASLYYLSSTPIESIRYNPESNSVHAKVRVAEGTSMSVGREGPDTSRIGLRRRLFGSWFIHTYVDRDDVSHQNKVASFLEWSYGY